MTRIEAQRIAAERNKGCEHGVSYYAQCIAGTRMVTCYNNSGGSWYVVQNDNGYERIVAR